MVALGLTSCAALILGGKVLGGIASLVFFYSNPIAVWIINETEVSWTLVGAFILVGIGVIILAKALFFREG